MGLSFGIYKKKLAFFLGLFVVLTAIFYYVSTQLSQASINDIAVPTSSGSYTIDINLNKNGEVKVNDKYYNNLITSEKSIDELRYAAAEKEGMFIDQLTVYVHLPQVMTADQVKQDIVTAHGVGQKNFYIQDSQTLVYTASNVSPSATFTIVAQFSKGMFYFPWYKQILYYLYNLPGSVWLAISIIFPVLALVMLLFMFRQAIVDWKVKKPVDMVKEPPSDLTPAEVGVLTEGKVSARTVAAILLDLARRNYLSVANNGKEFTFARKRQIDLNMSQNVNLKSFEKILLSKIFTAEELTSTVENIQVRIGHHVFSKKVAEVYLEIYQSVTKKGFFMENPSLMHNKFRKWGIVMFFAGLVGFIFGIFIAPDPKFLLLFWAAMIFTSFIIMRMSPQLPARTLTGQKEMDAWLKFKNFLCDATPISYTEGIQEVFEKYLPYAIAMNCEVEWAKRFIEHPFRQPDWYISNKNVVILEDFINELFPVIGFVARELAASREPIV